MRWFRGVLIAPTTKPCAGMTLVEVVVAVCIIAAVSVFVTSAFLTVLNINAKSNIGVKDAAGVEQSIAGVAPAGEVSSENIGISFGGVKLPSTADTYTQGGKSYTVIQGSDVQAPDPVYFGDGAGALPGGIETGSPGGKTEAPYLVTLAGRYQLEVWGAQGGGAASSGRNGFGGKGGYASGVVTLKENDALYLYVGGAGTSAASGADARISGGFNGGGAGYNTNQIRTGGGGGSDIRVNTDSLYARVIAAGGGGGGAIYDTYNFQGGAGGGLNGADADMNGYVLANFSGLGGTQNNGGRPGYINSGYMPAGFGLGESQTVSTSTRSGGGGGWYGGSATGGGGSGWVFTRAAYDAWGNPDDKPLYLLDDAYHLADAKTIAGNVSMQIPDPLSDIETPAYITGKAGGGFIRITYLGK
jgi:hypothetical protein